MSRSQSTTSGICLATLWSIAKITALAVVLLRFGPLLLSLTPISSSALQLTASVGCLTRIPEAITAVREEQRRTEAEREAFEEFTAEVKQLDATNNPGAAVTTVASRSLHGSSPTVGDSTDTVRALYRESVMAVDHYEAEYGEPLPANIATELGVDFGTALSTSGPLTIPLQRALIQMSRLVAHERREFESLVQSELDSLTDAETRLRSAAETVTRVRDRDFTRRPIEDIESSTHQLQTVEQECESLIADRQIEYVQAPVEDGLNLQEYLFHQYEWTHPVVGDALDLIKHVYEVEEQIITSVSDRF